MAFDAAADFFVGRIFSASFFAYSRVSASCVILVTATMCSALFSALSSPRFSRCRTVFPEDAGMGFTPAREAKAASLRTLPSCDHAVRHFAALIAPEPLPFQQRCGLANFDQLVQLLLIGHELLIEFEEMLSQANGLVPGDGQGQFFLPGPPPRDFRNLGGGEGLRASVAERRCQAVRPPPSSSASCRATKTHP